MTSVGVLLDESADFREGIGIPIDELDELVGVLQFVEGIGIFAHDLREDAEDGRLLFLDFSSCLMVGGGMAMDAEILMSGRVTSTPAAGQRADLLGLLFTDVLPVEAGQFAIGVVGEDTDVSGSGLRAADPAVMVFDMGLVQVSRSQERGAGLSEIREGHRTLDTCPVCSGVERLVDGRVADLIGRVETTPHRIGRATARMVVKPAVNVRDRWDEHDRPSALLTLDSDLKSVFVVLDVAIGECFELSTTQSGIELQGDHGRITRVLGVLDHRDDVLFPMQHLSRIGRRIVVAGGARWDPVEGLGDAVAVSDVLSDDTESGSVVPVRFLVVVLTVDPRDDLLGSVTVFDGASEPADLFGHDDTVAEQFFVSVVAILLLEKREAVVQPVEDVTIGVRDVRRILHALAESVNLLWNTHAGWCSDSPFKFVAFNPNPKAHPWLNYLGSKPYYLKSRQSSRRADGCRAGGMSA